MDDERDAEDAIRGLDQIEFGRDARRIRVEWTKEERSRGLGGSKRSSANSRPTRTLFVINFDPYNTRTRDLERHFDPYGKILNIRIRKNFAFIQYESQDQATKALDATNMSKLMDRVISVEYAIKDDDERRNGYSPDRGRDRSSKRGDQGRSPSPYRRVRASPDYGHGRSSRRSPSPHHRNRGSPDYANGHGRSHSPITTRREHNSDSGRDRSPNAREVRNSDYDKRPNHYKRSPSSENGRRHSPKERVSPDYGREQSPGPYSPDIYHQAGSPNLKPELLDSPGYTRADSPGPKV